MRVVVAMSGGVDSSAAAALLKEQGHEVIGITLRVTAYEGRRSGSCCSPEDIDDARAVAQTLGIPFYVANVEELFRSTVVQPFIDSYLQGKTPIPCVSCNQHVKFDFLLQRARALGARLATGHYARIAREGDRFLLRRAADPAKDQSYFLFTLGQRELSEIEFPVGEMTKAEVRAVAERHQLPTSRKPESMEICFVPGNDYAGFVERQAGPQPGGEIVDRSGAVLGSHEGIHRFTVGQRRGLGVNGPEPRYVQEIDPQSRRVVVGPAAEGTRQTFRISGARWVDAAPGPDQAVEVKIRHRHRGAAARVCADGTSATVELDVPVWAVTPGQAAVFYDRDRVLGGGWIC